MILVTGGNGFVGPKIVRAARARPPGARSGAPPGDRSAATLAARGSELVQGDMTDAESLRRAAEGAEVVVHLVAIRQGSDDDFRQVMEQGTRDLVAAAKDAGVRRFVLMSALGTSEETKDLVPYYRAKWEMEQTVQGSGVEHVVFRPSFVFAGDGGILPTFTKLASRRPRHADHRLGHAAHPADLDRRRRRLLCGWGRQAGSGEPDLRARRARRRELERVLAAAEARARPAPAERPRADGSHAAERPRHRATPGKHSLTRDLLTMLEHGDNVTSNDDAVRTFGLTLAPLDEQLRRAT